MHWRSFTELEKESEFMATTTYVMFGTDVVSCIYADQWNKSSEVDAPIAGFVDASNGARETLAAYRPSAELLHGLPSLPSSME